MNDVIILCLKFMDKRNVCIYVYIVGLFFIFLKYEFVFLKNFLLDLKYVINLKLR